MPGEPVEVGFYRDASWYNHPNVSSPKKVHRARPEDLAMAVCSTFIILNTEHPVDITKVILIARCRRCWR